MTVNALARPRCLGPSSSYRLQETAPWGLAQHCGTFVLPLPLPGACWKEKNPNEEEFCKNFDSFLMDKYALSWTTEIFYFYFFQNILNNKIVVQVIKFTANSTWKRQTVFLIMQFEKHMSKHKWISLLRILPARLARHSSVGWKAVNRELWLLPSLLSPAFRDLLQCLELQSHSNTCRDSKELFWSRFTDGIIQSKEKQKYKSRGDRKMPFVSSTSPANFNSFSINPSTCMTMRAEESWEVWL